MDSSLAEPAGGGGGVFVFKRFIFTLWTVFLNLYGWQD